MEQGDTEEVANEKINTPLKPTRQVFKIWKHHISNQQVWADEITEKVLEPPKLVPQHSLIFGNGIRTFHMYIPESTPQAVLVLPSAGFGNAWVTMRFRKCRKAEQAIP